MNDRTIMTVLGPALGTDLGYCQPHEHVWVENTPAAGLNPLLRIDQADLSLAELLLYHQAGGRALADAQPVGAGRHAERLADLSRQSQVTIVASTGYHLPVFYTPEHWIHTATEAQLTELFESELSLGMFRDGQHAWPLARTAIRAGLVKAAIGAEGPTGNSRKLLQAAGRAAVSQGAALMLHTESGQQATVAVELLNQLGLASDRILVCHIDRQAADLGPHLGLARLGVYLAYDTIGRFKYHDDASEIRLIQQMIQAGHIDQLLLSLDTTAGRLHHYGGEIGLDYLISQFIPQVQASGITAEQIRQMMVDNPARALSTP